jgi:hypothetical protein
MPQQNARPTMRTAATDGSETPVPDDREKST